MKSKSPTNAGSWKQLALVSLLAKNVADGFVKDRDSPGEASYFTLFLAGLIWAFAYAPHVAFPGIERVVWLALAIVATSLMLAWGPVARNSCTEFLAAVTPFAVDIALVSLTKVDVPIFYSIVTWSLVCGALIGVTIGIGAALADYDVVRRERRFAKASKKVAKTVVVASLCSMLIGAAVFIVIACSSNYNSSLTYFEEKVVEQMPIERLLENGGKGQHDLSEDESSFVC